LLKCVFVSWVDLLLCADVVSQLSGRIARWATNSGNQEVRTESEDISSRGVYFFLPTEIEKGSWVELALVSATRNNLSRACVRARYWHFTIVLRVRVELLVTTAGPPLIICHAGELTLAVKAVTLPLIHFPMTPADRYLWTLPMFHANGWTFVWTVTAAGGTHVCLAKVEAKTAFEKINSERITVICAAPTVLIFLSNAPEEVRKGVRAGVRVLTAGAPPAAATIERIESEFGWILTHVYGLTETSPFISVCEPRPEHQALSAPERCVIKARQGVELITSGELRVANVEGNEVPHDGQTLGEITASGNVVMKGYYDDPDATAEVIRNGWFYTGDAAVVHPDGYIEVRDRLKDVIISGGENISSVEVEGVLLRHAAVQEVAVVGFPDEKWGETPRAFVVLKPGASITEDELRQFARERMAHFKIPQSFIFLPELPKTATGKIQKYVLRGKKAAIYTQ
jgi:fatty-acyl-CoA synthase